MKLDYKGPGEPTDNGVIRSFNGRLSDEFLNVHEFVTMHDSSGRAFGDFWRRGVRRVEVQRTEFFLAQNSATISIPP